MLKGAILGFFMILPVSHSYGSCEEMLSKVGDSLLPLAQLKLARSAASYLREPAGIVQFIQRNRSLINASQSFLEFGLDSKLTPENLAKMKAQLEKDLEFPLNVIAVDKRDGNQEIAEYHKALMLVQKQMLPYWVAPQNTSVGWGAWPIGLAIVAAHSRYVMDDTFDARTVSTPIVMAFMVRIFTEFFASEFHPHFRKFSRAIFDIAILTSVGAGLMNIEHSQSLGLSDAGLLFYFAAFVRALGVFTGREYMGNLLFSLSLLVAGTHWVAQYPVAVQTGPFASALAIAAYGWAKSEIALATFPRLRVRKMEDLSEFVVKMPEDTEAMHLFHRVELATSEREAMAGDLSKTHPNFTQDLLSGDKTAYLVIHQFLIPKKEKEFTQIQLFQLEFR